MLMPVRRRTIGVVVLLLGLVFLLSAIFYIRQGRSASSASQDLSKVRLSTSKNLWCTLSLVAIDQGFFEREGLNVDTVYQLAGRQNMDALVSKSVDIANVVEVNLAYQALNGNANLVVPASIVYARDFSVVARRQSGIAAV